MYVYKKECHAHNDYIVPLALGIKATEGKLLQNITVQYVFS